MYDSNTLVGMYVNIYFFWRIYAKNVLVTVLNIVPRHRNVEDIDIIK